MSNFIFRRREAKLFGGKLLLALLVLVFAVLAVHIFAQLQLHRGAPSEAIVVDTVNRLSVDSEISVTTWLAGFLGIIASGLAWLIGRVQTLRPARWSWYLLAAVALFISIDEVASLHELLLQALHTKAGLGETQTLESNAWMFILPFVAVGLVVTLTYWYRNLPRRTFWRLLLAFAVFVLGAVVIEYAATEVDKGGRKYTIGYVVAEEGLEYLGLWLMIRACLAHISEFERGLRQRLVNITSR